MNSLYDVLSKLNTEEADAALSQIEDLKAFGLVSSELANCLYSNVSKLNLTHTLFREMPTAKRALDVFAFFFNQGRQEEFFAGKEKSYMYFFCKEAIMKRENHKDILDQIIDIGDIDTGLAITDEDYYGLDVGKISMEVGVYRPADHDEYWADDLLEMFDNVQKIGFTVEDLARQLFNGGHHWFFDREKAKLIFDIIAPAEDIVTGQSRMVDESGITYAESFDEFRHYFDELIAAGFDKMKLAKIYGEFTRGDIYTYEIFSDITLEKRLNLAYNCSNSYDFFAPIKPTGSTTTLGCFAGDSIFAKFYNEDPSIAVISLAIEDFDAAYETGIFALREDFYGDKEIDGRSIIYIEKIISDAYKLCVEKDDLQSFFGKNGTLARICRDSDYDPEELVVRLMYHNDEYVHQFIKFGCMKLPTDD